MQPQLPTFKAAIPERDRMKASSGPLNNVNSPMLGGVVLPLEGKAQSLCGRLSSAARDGSEQATHLTGYATGSFNRKNSIELSGEAFYDLQIQVYRDSNECIKEWWMGLYMDYVQSSGETLNGT
ncbi:hypothetical protein cyc_01726 [Cyclospora cayetanensis]|uniref:Uncharacterized protein n=1 Tax=Cyclospora cayetanensis TaxID=88456 RepID=A0A1D3D4V4_9EIME|nr:hypothetical protein cyc_01726 [Cyclospora cayetanensis]